MRNLAPLLLFGVFAFGVQAQNNRFDINESFSNIENVEVSMVFSEVYVEESNSDNVDVNGYIEWEDGKKEYSITAQKKGATLHIKLEHPNKVKGKNKGKLYISVPSATNLELNTVSGTINVSNVGNDYVNCNTVSGNIILNKIACNVDLNTVSGDMDVTSIKGSATTNTVSGDVEANTIKGNFEGNSVSGDFTLRGLKGKRSISTLSGDVD